MNIRKNLKRKTGMIGKLEAKQKISDGGWGEWSEWGRRMEAWSMVKKTLWWGRVKDVGVDQEGGENKWHFRKGGSAIVKHWK